MTIRKHDPDVITLTTAEFADAVRSGGDGKSAFKEWTRLILAILLPLAAVIMLFSRTAFQAEQNKSDIVKHTAWIECHAKDTEAIRESLASMSKAQAVILEKVTTIQKQIDDKE